MPNPVFWANTPGVAPEEVGSSPPNFQGSCPGDGSTLSQRPHPDITHPNSKGSLFTRNVFFAPLSPPFWNGLFVLTNDVTKWKKDQRCHWQKWAKRRYVWTRLHSLCLRLRHYGHNAKLYANALTNVDVDAEYEWTFRSDLALEVVWSKCNNIEQYKTLAAAIEKWLKKLECIPVGCVPSAAVAAIRCAVGVYVGGVGVSVWECLCRGGFFVWGGALWQRPPPLPCGHRQLWKHYLPATLFEGG